MIILQIRYYFIMFPHGSIARHKSIYLYLIERFMRQRFVSID